jgi:hypothetical protein
MLRPNLKPFLPLRLESVRVVGAWLCLAAAAMLWMPVLAAAWNAHVMACCDGKMCTTQGHRHSKQTQKASSDAGAPINCGHSQSGAQGGSQTSSITRCAMSCCHDQEQFTSPGMVFVLPEATLHGKPFSVESSVFLADARQITVLFGPLSPPPRNNFSIA